MTKTIRQTKHEKTTAEIKQQGIAIEQDTKIILSKIAALQDELAKKAKRISHQSAALIALVLVSVGLLLKGEIDRNKRPVAEKAPVKTEDVVVREVASDIDVQNLELKNTARAVSKTASNVDRTLGGLQKILTEKTEGAHKNSSKSQEMSDLLIMPLEQFIKVGDGMKIEGNGPHKLYTTTVRRGGAQLTVRSFDDCDYRSFEIVEGDGSVRSGVYTTNKDSYISLEYRKGEHHVEWVGDHIGSIKNRIYQGDASILESPSFPEVTNFMLKKLEENERPRNARKAFREKEFGE